MADLSDLNAALNVKVSGANPSTGVEDNFMEVDSSGNAQVKVNNAAGASAVNIQDGGNSITVDGSITSVQGTSPWISKDIVTSGTYGAISVSTSAVEAKVGASALTNRKVLIITPTNGTIYFGTNSGVTTSNGTPIFKNQSRTLAFSDAVSIFLIAGSSINVRIVEGA